MVFNQRLVSFHLKADEGLHLCTVELIIHIDDGVIFSSFHTEQSNYVNKHYTSICKGKWMNIKGFIKILWPTVIILPKQKLISKLIYFIFIKLDGE